MLYYAPSRVLPQALLSVVALCILMYIHLINNMSTTIQKWGNSLGVRLPLDLTRRYGLRQGSSVRIVAAKENIMLEPLSAPRLSLKAMVGKISKKNLHQEFSWGKQVGKEVW